MTYKLGIIPAAGKASRFGGLNKELLPTREGISFLERAVKRLPVDRVVIVTNTDKIAAHARVVGPNADYIIQHERIDIWGAIKAAIKIPTDRYYFTMPDTLMPDDAMAKTPAADFVLGVFCTMKPERYGVLVDRQVINKKAGLPTPAYAWGCLVWSRAVVDFWNLIQPETYTQAINYAMRKVTPAAFELGYYHDNAGIADYLEYMKKDDNICKRCGKPMSLVCLSSCGT